MAYSRYARSIGSFGKRDKRRITAIWGDNAFTITGNPFWGSNLLEVNIGRDFGALEGVTP